MPKVHVERVGAVAVVAFDNPPMGYLDAAVVAELDAVTAGVAADDAVRAVVFTSRIPGVFIRHYDVAELSALSRNLRAKGRTFSEERLAPERPLDGVFARLETMPKAAIAAIDGIAMGGGFEFCLACDIRIAARGPYTLGQPEINIGILAGAGGTQRLARVVGPARALEMSLRGRVVTPDEAASIGMVHEAVDGSAFDRAMEIAAECARKPPRATGHIKRLIRLAHETPLSRGLALERTLFLDLAVSDEAAALMETMVRDGRDIRDM
ncbi:MAG: enoyl-CoA hydratase/isomerase family protein [Rhodospirillales bacterium]|nr:enoyl-CoA hydratase/isomerase family protein [Rhodospirillales bacterium]